LERVTHRCAQPIEVARIETDDPAANIPRQRLGDA
jgi:hypothetical protein